MKRVLAILIAATAMTVGLTAGTASARVHGISQAGCANNPALSGANQAQGGGIPTDGAIPVAASPFETGDFPGEGGDGDAACDVPTGPPVPND